MFSSELRRKLSEIARGKQVTPTESVPSLPTRPAYACDYVFRGEENDCAEGPFLLGLCRMSEMVTDACDIAREFETVCQGIGREPCKMLFVDLETCGLSGVPLFLVGTMTLDGQDFTLRQFFARDYSEERSVLFRVGELMRESGALVTFNGKTFDLPFLRDRMIRHRLEFEVPCDHVDLLQWARPKWRRRLPDCRLQTLEAHLCHRYRSGDVPGREIPRLYHEYVKSGNFEPLLPVLKHNAMDLMTMAELLPKLVEHRP